MLLYYITDRNGLAGDAAEQRARLLERIAAAARAGVDYIQLREKDLSARELESLARDAVRAVRDHAPHTKLLINSRTDIALACDADGVHLAAGEIAASEVRALWMHGCSRPPIIGVSAHTVADVRYAEAHGANFAVLAPIFEKLHSDIAPIGPATLREACVGAPPPGNTEAAPSSRFAVFALGGVTLANATACVAAGAVGVAGIRLFQTGDVRETVQKLRA